MWAWASWRNWVRDSGEGKARLFSETGAASSEVSFTDAENGASIVESSVEGLKGVGMSNGEPAGSSSLFLAGGRRIGY